jgi:hypothetical protein
MHPRLRQVPPRGPLSTTATFMPRLMAAFAMDIPDPEPMIRTSYFSITISMN